MSITFLADRKTLIDIVVDLVNKSVPIQYELDLFELVNYTNEDIEQLVKSDYNSKEFVEIKRYKGREVNISMYEVDTLQDIKVWKTDLHNTNDISQTFSSSISFKDVLAKHNAVVISEDDETMLPHDLYAVPYIVLSANVGETSICEIRRLKNLTQGITFFNKINDRYNNCIISNNNKKLEIGHTIIQIMLGLDLSNIVKTQSIIDCEDFNDNIAAFILL
jgi:hypothetical protein